MKIIRCDRCKEYLGELATGSKIRVGTVHLCEGCGKILVAEAFRKKNGDFAGDMFDFLKGFHK